MIFALSNYSLTLLKEIIEQPFLPLVISVMLRCTILKWFIGGCSAMSVWNGCNDPAVHLGSWLCYRALHVATVGENPFWMQLSWHCMKALQSNSPASPGVTVPGGLNQCRKHRATLIYNSEGIAPHEPGKGNACLPGAQQPWKEAVCSQLSRNEAAPSVHGNS